MDRLAFAITALAALVGGLAIYAWLRAIVESLRIGSDQC